MCAFVQWVHNVRCGLRPKGRAGHMRCTLRMLLPQLARLAHSERTLPALVDFVDIAGLIEGAHAGAGLGNKFLADVRSATLIAQVVRCFPGNDVIHVHDDGPDPVRDVLTIENELILADLQTVERRLSKPPKKSAAPGIMEELQLLRQVQPLLEDGLPARYYLLEHDLTPGQAAVWARCGLLSAKPVLYIANTDVGTAAQNDGPGAPMVQALREHCAATAAEAAARLTLDLASLAEHGGEGSHLVQAARRATLQPPILPICAEVEAEIAAAAADASTPEEAAEIRQEFLAEFGFAQTGLDAITKQCAQLLGITTFFTTGPTESRAWEVPKGATAQEAAGKIHTDMARGFIRAETATVADIEAAGSWDAAKAAGKVRAEGKSYVVQDGDVIVFRFNV